jgi:hypothetical protein
MLESFSNKTIQFFQYFTNNNETNGIENATHNTLGT